MAAYWASAHVKRGRGRPAVERKRPTLNMRIDADVLEAFKATGQGWQTRINAELRDGGCPKFCVKGQMGRSVDIFQRTYTTWITGQQDDQEMDRWEAAMATQKAKQTAT